MPTLEECKKLVISLEKELGWGTDINLKLLYAIVEIAEAIQIYKHRERLLKEGKLLYEISNDMIEELIDAIFYIIHACYHINKHADLDVFFKYKYNKNLKRRRSYLDDNKSD